jgi:NitT/TauT family transport system substrate-binding protein
MQRSRPRAEGIRLPAEGKIDAFMGFPPDPQQLRARKIGYVVVNSAADRPWSQYFCCLVASSDGQGPGEELRLRPPDHAGRVL